MSVAILGGLGYVGRHLAQQLLVMGIKTVIIDARDDRAAVGDLSKFDKTGKSLHFAKITLPTLTTTLIDVLAAHRIHTVINLMGRQSNPATTLYMTKYLYAQISHSLPNVKTFIHCTPHDDTVGYGKDNRFEGIANPENFLKFAAVNDENSKLFVMVLRLPEAYGHDMRIRQMKNETHHIKERNTSNSLWMNLESFRKGLIKSVPVYRTQLGNKEFTPTINLMPIFDVCGSIIDSMSYCKAARFSCTFAATDIASQVFMTTEQFIKLYEENEMEKGTVKTKAFTNGPIQMKAKSDGLAGIRMIQSNILFPLDYILSNRSLNNTFMKFEFKLMDHTPNDELHTANKRHYS